MIRSTCDTAAGGARDAGVLPGVARTFFHAGTPALLVSHWYINSAATVATKAVRELQG